MLSDVVTPLGSAKFGGDRFVVLRVQKRICRVSRNGDQHRHHHYRSPPTNHEMMLAKRALTTHARNSRPSFCFTECRLDFVATFCFHRSVRTPSADDATSWIASDVTAAAQRGAVAFTTHWSLVLEAEGESAIAQEASEKVYAVHQ